MEPNSSIQRRNSQSGKEQCTPCSDWRSFEGLIQVSQHCFHTVHTGQQFREDKLRDRCYKNHHCGQGKNRDRSSTGPDSSWGGPRHPKGAHQRSTHRSRRRGVAPAEEEAAAWVEEERAPPSSGAVHSDSGHRDASWCRCRDPGEGWSLLCSPLSIGAAEI